MHQCFAYMPIYKQFSPQPGTEIAIWKIEEPESFFVGKTGFTSERKNELRRIEHVAGRFLLQYLDADFPIFKVEVSTLGKPYLPKELGPHFSISHSYPYIAACISQNRNVGVDVQVYREKIIRLQHKFLSEKEQQFCDNSIEKITIAWCAKEAVFKWYGDGEMDFIAHMPIEKFTFNENHFDLEMNLLKGEMPKPLRIKAFEDKEFAFAYVE